MKQIRVHGPGDVRLDDVADPEPGPGDALVRIAACGICGTDVSYAHMGSMTGGPMPLGHEMSGVVEWLASDVAGAAVGDRVIVCPADGTGDSLGSGSSEGGLTPLLLVRNASRRLHPVPEGMPLRTAALAEPLAVGMHAVNQADVARGDRVAVFGCGPIGLLTLATLADRGIEDVAAIDLSPARLKLARQVGAAHTINAADGDVWAELKRVHGTAPFRFGPTAATDAYIEASGADSVIGDVLRNGRVGGRMSIVALHYRPVPTNYVDVLMKEFTIRGSMEYPERFEDAVELLARHDLSGLITHTLALAEFHRGLEILDGSKDCGKVLITMDNEL